MTLPGETIATGASKTCSECGITPNLDIYHSGGGYYIGTRCKCGPYSRESGYYKTFKLAEIALDKCTFGR